MFETVLSFIDRHDTFILTTHDSPDVDGVGAQLVAASILKMKGKKFRIINSSLLPTNLKFIEEGACIEKYDKEIHSEFLEKSALFILDTSDEHHMGPVAEILDKVKEVFIMDHHEPAKNMKLNGFFDTSAASTSELAIELACAVGVELDPQTATAAYAGIVYDSGFFAYPKTSVRTFHAAIKTIEWGAVPNHIYRQLMENYSYAALLLQKQALKNMEFFTDRRIAVITLSREDYEITGAEFEEAEYIVNMPLKTKEVEVSILIRENPQGDIRCSLRSKGEVNVSEVADIFGGGGHNTASGFKSASSIEETLKKLLLEVEARLV
ncbi:MAG: bifunctional oligoribonuclease/PAP phosphatase NrnA [Treponema sp.]|jgi:phosphoesterase RecJ-like protein|nr:bifunctional oligoribonuclease/PAP phosphatase NrnA [Treponema sp.]